VSASVDTDPDVRIERHRSIEVITLHRPATLNAVDRDMVLELIAAVDRADTDPDVHGIVITGTGRAFCAGADLPNGTRTFADDESDADEALATGLVTAVHPSDPVLAAAVQLASQIATTSAPIATAVTRQLVRHGLVADRPHDIHRLDSRATFQRGRSADVAEGIQAFLDKRPARFPQGLDELAATDPATLPCRRP